MSDEVSRLGSFVQMYRLCARPVVDSCRSERYRWILKRDFLGQFYSLIRDARNVGVLYHPFVDWQSVAAAADQPRTSFF